METEAHPIFPTCPEAQPQVGITRAGPCGPAQGQREQGGTRVPSASPGCHLLSTSCTPSLEALD